MSDTASSSPDSASIPRPSARVLIPAWAAFAGINLWLMFLLPGRETIPFHLIWFSLALVYGAVPWGLRTMVAALAVVTVVTYVALRHHADAGYIGEEELAEVPLMAAIFLAMVWHVRRRQAALAEMERLAAIERDRAEAEQMFVRLMSHEMRTPITVARGYTELIQAAIGDGQAQDDSSIVLDELAKLDRSTRRLAMLMAPERSADLRPADLDQLLGHAVRRWAPTADRRWAVDSSAGSVLLDAERLETAVDCLLENAIRFTAPGDRIEICCRRDRDHVLIEVRDNGTGIPPEDVEHVFDAFHRGTNAAHAGTGLGLSIVRRIVEMRGGTAQVDSRLGGGTTFTLRLPVALPPAEGQQRGVIDELARRPRPASPIG